MIKGAMRYIALICMFAVFASMGSVYASWLYATNPPNEQHLELDTQIEAFVYKPEMPGGEVSLLQRLDDILNQRYTTENVSDARKYLIEETIRVQWEEGAYPYVGSMDTVYATQIHELFGDILDEMNVSFILKNEDLNWDGYNEIALYSTSDPLDCVETHFNGIVGVYVSVFTPFVDEAKNVIGYTLVCDSMYGFCNEVYYNPDRATESSFSTTDWRDNLVYWHHELDTQPMPDDALGLDGESLYKYHYDSYHSMKYYYEGYPWGYTTVWIQGRTAGQKLDGLIPWIG